MKVLSERVFFMDKIAIGIPTTELTFVVRQDRLHIDLAADLLPPEADLGLLPRGDQLLVLVLEAGVERRKRFFCDVRTIRL